MKHETEFTPRARADRRSYRMAAGALAVSAFLTSCEAAATEPRSDERQPIPGVTLVPPVPESEVRQGNAPVETTPAEEAILTPEISQEMSLQQSVQEFAERHAGTADLGLMVYDWENDELATYHDTEPFLSASLYKLFVAYDVLEKVDRGELQLTDTLELAREPSRDVEIGEDGITVEECLNRMIRASSNTCGRSLGELVGWKELDAKLRADGYTGTVLDGFRNGEEYIHQLTTAKDVGSLLYRLYTNELLSPESTALFIEHLEGQEVDYALPTGVPEGVALAHKTGLIDTEEYGNYSHDVGVLTSGDRKRIVVMLTGNWPGTLEQTHADSPALFAEFGALMSAQLIAEK